MSEQPGPIDPGVVEPDGRVSGRGQGPLAAAFSDLPEMTALFDQPRP